MKTLGTPHDRVPLIIIGAQRSGTTFLAKCLESFPEVVRLENLGGEPRFWMKPEASGERFYDAFNGPKPNDFVKVYLEKSTSYLDFPYLASKIRYHLPGARILVALREPLGRAVSHYKFSRDNGLETLPIGDAFEADLNEIKRAFPETLSTSPFSYLTRGRYDLSLRSWRTEFPPEQLKILLFEEFTSANWDWKPLLSWLGISQQLLDSAPSFEKVKSTYAYPSQHWSEVDDFSAFFEPTKKYLRNSELKVDTWWRTYQTERKWKPRN